VTGIVQSTEVLRVPALQSNKASVENKSTGQSHDSAISGQTWIGCSSGPTDLVNARTHWSDKRVPNEEKT